MIAIARDVHDIRSHLLEDCSRRCEGRVVSPHLDKQRMIRTNELEPHSRTPDRRRQDLSHAWPLETVPLTDETTPHFGLACQNLCRLHWHRCISAASSPELAHVSPTFTLRMPPKSCCNWVACVTQTSCFLVGAELFKPAPLTWVVPDAGC